jgi:hypothetical protein
VQGEFHPQLRRLLACPTQLARQDGRRIMPHHEAPVLGLSGAAIFLNAYKTPLL